MVYMDMTALADEEAPHAPHWLFIPIVHFLPKARPKRRDARVPGGDSVL